MAIDWIKLGYSRHFQTHLLWLVFISNLYHSWLVVSTILKNMSSSVGMIISYMKWKIKFMFQTTNQNLYHSITTIPVLSPLQPVNSGPRNLIVSSSFSESVLRAACIKGCGDISDGNIRMSVSLALSPAPELAERSDDDLGVDLTYRKPWGNGATGGFFGRPWLWKTHMATSIWGSNSCGILIMARKNMESSGWRKHVPAPPWFM